MSAIPAIDDFASAASGRFALSVDVEDYFQVWAFSSVIERSSWDGFSLRVGDATRATLDLFDRCDAKATFFTLGWVAERDPDLIKEIVRRGHELASHGYDHTKVFDQTPAQFFEDAKRTKHLLEDVAGVPVIGYRAAGFSIDQRTPWAHEALAELGHEYSSSSHPIAHDHYGDPDSPRAPYKPVTDAAFVEAPVATADMFGRRVSCAGGGWFRANPYGLSKRLISKASKTLGGPVIFYFHPWEIDVDQPRIKTAPLRSRLRHYMNLGSMEAKLERLLRDFSWERIDQVLNLNTGASVQ